MAKPLDTSSGDILADRRADYAEMLFGSGEAAPAAELMLGALELAPGWAMGWIRLGEFHEAAGKMEAAAGAWRMAQKLDPSDRAGAGLKLAIAGATPAVAVPPSAFVEALFDQYAEKFDHALVETLGYRVPEFLAEAIAAQGRKKFGLAVDLGCGTGLMGERLRPLAKCSSATTYRAKCCARRRPRMSMTGWRRPICKSFAYAGEKADLVTAADVFMYVGALEGIVKTVAGMLTSTVCSPSRSRSSRALATLRFSPRGAMRIRKSMSGACCKPSGCRWIPLRSKSSGRIAASPSWG